VTARIEFSDITGFRDHSGQSFGIIPWFIELESGIDVRDVDGDVVDGERLHEGIVAAESDRTY